MSRLSSSSRLSILASFGTISFPEAAILLYSDGDHPLDKSNGGSGDVMAFGRLLLCLLCYLYLLFRLFADIFMFYSVWWQLPLFEYINFVAQLL